MYMYMLPLCSRALNPHFLFLNRSFKTLCRVFALEMHQIKNLLCATVYK